MFIEAEYIWLYPLFAVTSALQCSPILFLINSENRRKYSLTGTLASWFTLVTVLYFIGLLKINELVIINMLGYLLNLLALAIWTDKCYIGNRTKKIGMFLIIYCILVTVDGLLGMFFSFASKDPYSTYNMLYLDKFVNSVFVTIIYWLFAYGSYSLWKMKKLKIMGKSICFCCMIICLQIFAFIALTLKAADSNAVLIIASGLIILISQFLLFHGLFMTIRSVQREKEAAEIANYRYMEKNYYENLHVSFAEIRKLRHDIYNELTAVSSLIKNKDTIDSGRELFKEIEHKYINNDANIFCKIPLINAVLHNKSLVAEKLRSGFLLDLDHSFLNDEENLAIELYDLCSVLGNILDNALYAVSTAAEDQRMITLKLYRSVDYVFIRCTNTFGSETPAEGIGRKSGLGTSILNDIAQKYDGKFILDECGGKYIASISLKEVR